MIPEVPKRGARHLRSASNIQNRRSNGSSILPQDIQVHYNPQASDRHSLNSNHLNLTQQHINAALFNSNSPSYSAQPLVQRNPKMPSPVTASSKNFNGQELHMAEILVESAAHQQRSAFQFDTITPKKNQLKMTPNNSNNNGADGNFNDAPLSSVMLDSGIELSSAQDVVESSQSPKENSNKLDELESTEARANDEQDYESSTQPNSSFDLEENDHDVDAEKCKTIESINTSSSSDDNGGFVTPPSENERQSKNHHKVKRATVVGNPMFSSSPEDSDLGPSESLGLDDLDMDYEQIMHYFDNLKVNRRQN